VASDKPSTYTLGYGYTLEPYYFEPNMLQTPKLIAVTMVKWIIAWKKIHAEKNTCGPCEGCQVFFLPANFESDGMTSHKDGLAAKNSLKMAAFEVGF